MDQFKVENQYQLYLQRVRLKESQMHSEQKVQTRRAFMAGFGQMLILLRDGIGILEENIAVEKMHELLNQVEQFWFKETNQTN